MLSPRLNIWTLLLSAFIGGLTIFVLNQLASANASGEFVAAIVGAVVGGSIGLVGQWMTIGAATKERLDDRHQRHVATGHALFMKVTTLHSNLHKIDESVRQSIELAREHGAPKWGAFRPIVNLPLRINFTPEEMSLLLLYKDDDLLNQLLSLDVVHNSVIDIMTAYAEDRSELLANMPAESVSGIRATTTLNPEQMALLAPKMAALDDLIEKLRQRGPIDVREAQEARDALVEFLNSRLGLTLGVTMRP